MAWEWSHSADGIENVRQNIDRLERDKLIIIYAEWRAAQGKRGLIDGFNPQFSERKYGRALSFAQGLSSDALANFIWEKTEELATCENGGHDAYVCPFGCHTVSFSKEETLCD